MHTANLMVGMSLFGGGLVQLLAGMWEIARGDGLCGTSKLRTTVPTLEKIPTNFCSYSLLGLHWILVVLRDDLHPGIRHISCRGFGARVR